MRFWNRVSRAPDDCWTWLGGTDPKGYGRFSISGIDKVAHRVAYELTVAPIPSGFCVCHMCDNPGCCRPSHLWAGTKKQNTADMHQKRRWHQGSRENLPRGEAHYRARLTAEQVREIRQLRAEGLSHWRLSKMYGVAPGAVWTICCGRSWKHV
jgi:hypothetical protein